MTWVNTKIILISVMAIGIVFLSWFLVDLYNRIQWTYLHLLAAYGVYCMVKQYFAQLSKHKNIILTALALFTAVSMLYCLSIAVWMGWEYLIHLNAPCEVVENNYIYPYRYDNTGIYILITGIELLLCFFIIVIGHNKKNKYGHE